MSHLTLLVLLVSPLATLAPVQEPPARSPEWRAVLACTGTRPRLFGLASRPLSLTEMVTALRRGCLALEDVRFREGEDTIEWISPARFSQIARALSLARGMYRVTVPPERAPGLWPDTVQARRREVRLLDELVHYGASASRLRSDPLLSTGRPGTFLAAPPGSAIPMLIRVSDEPAPSAPSTPVQRPGAS